MNRDDRFIDIEEGGLPELAPSVNKNENWCFDCGQLVSTHPGWFPIQALFEMHMHWGTVEHHRWRVEKSKGDPDLWLVKQGDTVITSFHRNVGGWHAAVFVAFERHPWTKHLRAEKRLRDQP